MHFVVQSTFWKNASALFLIFYRISSSFSYIIVLTKMSVVYKALKKHYFVILARVIFPPASTFLYFLHSIFMFAGVDVPSMGISSIEFAIKRSFCVSSMAVFILLSCRSTKKS